MNPYLYLFLFCFLAVPPARGQVVYPLHQEATYQTLIHPSNRFEQFTGWVDLQQPLGIKNLLSADINFCIRTSHGQVICQYLVNRFPGYQSHQLGSRISISGSEKLLFSAAIGLGVHRSSYRASCSYYARMDHAFYLQLNQHTQMWFRLADWLELIWPENGHLGRATLDIMMWQQLTPLLKAMVFVRSGQVDWINLGAGVYIAPERKHQILITCGLYPAGLGVGYVYNSHHWRFSLLLVQTNRIGTTPSTTVQWL